MGEELLKNNLRAKELSGGMTQDAFLSTCVRSKIAVDIFIEHHKICNCRILSHDQKAILVRLNGKAALLYKASIQAIVPEGETAGGFSADYGHILADVRTQYVRHLTQNRTSRTIKGN